MKVMQFAEGPNSYKQKVRIWKIMVVYPQKGKCKTIMNYELWIVYKNRTIAVGSDATSLNMHFCPWKLKKVLFVLCMP